MYSECATILAGMGEQNPPRLYDKTVATELQRLLEDPELSEPTRLLLRTVCDVLAHAAPPELEHQPEFGVSNCSLLLDRDLRIVSITGHPSLAGINFPTKQAELLIGKKLNEVTQDPIIVDAAAQIWKLHDESVLEGATSGKDFNHADTRRGVIRADGRITYKGQTALLELHDGELHTYVQITVTNSAVLVDRHLAAFEKEQAEKVSRLVNLVIQAVHSLKTPLSTIHTQLYLLQAVLPDLAKNKNLAVINRQLEIILQIIEANLTLTKLAKLETNSLEYSNVFVTSLADELSAWQQEYREKHYAHTGKQFEFEIVNSCPGETTLECHQSSVLELIKNLLQNSFRHTSEGRVTLGFGLCDANNRLELDNIQTPGLLILVSDTGDGMDEATQAHVFNPGFTAPTSSSTGELRGTGFGLAIARQVVEAHGGTIELESQVGEGTTFWIVLPLTQKKKKPS